MKAVYYDLVFENMAFNIFNVNFRLNRKTKEIDIFKKNNYIGCCRAGSLKFLRKEEYENCIYISFTIKGEEE